MIVLLNGSANNGKGLRKWARFRPDLEAAGLGRDYRLLTDPRGLAACVRGAPAAPNPVIVAAGGDGTVNAVLNSVMDLSAAERGRITLGAIGLGSSNDFHKPPSAFGLVKGRIPARLDGRNARPHNVGQVDFVDDRGRSRRKYFLVNGSVGIIAQANHLFNAGDAVLDRLKPLFVLGAIYYAALKTILSAPDVPATIRVGRECFDADITTLSVLINPHCSGNLKYDLDVDGHSDHLAVALCEGMGTAERVRTLGALARSRFRGLPKTRVWAADDVEIHPARPVAMEMDGEVSLARGIRIRLLRDCLRVCS